ncbi:MAG TPA: type 4a pilus biogenesis protein PilO [Deltaproteobacteria bacterium]|nr:type 4a pilus biogenesis protein PilO [Deltaproteobacteria bacterium]HPR54362.1 type 4a pilus biogenesis protein PilO [Deltaproteobacteria bacterium]HXK46999.1 type 4a pilus biogenesis protein PilO [Deltaproteobacteria bacterium]
MDKIIDTLLRQKPLIKVLVLVVILVAIIGLYWQFFYRPVLAEIRALEPELNQLKAELAAKKEIVKEKDRYIAELEQTRAKLYVALKQLPDKSEIPTLLENVSSLGTAAGLQFKLFKPMPEVAKNFYAEIPVDIQVEGKFRDVVTFFDSVSKMPRIVNIVNINMGKPKKDPTGGMQVAISCNAVTYKFIEGATTEPSEKNDKKTKEEKK